MKSDTLIYRFFKELPDCFFELLGRPASDANRYRFDAIELKDTAARIDGVYLPRPPDDREPMYFVEYQNYKSERTYSNLLLKIGLYLEKVNPRQNWQGVVIFPSHSIEQENVYPYRGLLQSEQMTRVYLEDLPEPSSESFGFAILRLIAAAPGEAMKNAQQLVPKVRDSAESAERQKKLIELIGTIVLYQLPKLSREEVEKMLQVNDFRETRVYQEALEEGIEQGMEKGIEQGIEQGMEKGIEKGRREEKKALALRLLEEKTPLKKIAEWTGLSPAAIKRLKKAREK